MKFEIGRSTVLTIATPFAMALALALIVAACASSSAPKAAPAPIQTPSAFDASTEGAAAPVASGPKPPVAAIVPHPTMLHGAVQQDDYFWLREKGSPNVVAYLEAENAYAEAMTAPTRPLEEALYREMLGRVVEADTSVPVARGKWLYYRRTEAGKAYPIYARKRKSGDAREEVMLDLNEIGQREKFVGLGPAAISDDGNLYAYALDTTGFRQYTLAIKDLRTGALSAERIPRVDDVAFASDGRTLLYVTEDKVTKRGNEVYRHVVGTDPSKDVLVYREDDEMFQLGLEKTRSKAYFVITSASHTTTEVRVVPATAPSATPRVLAPREHGHEYYVGHEEGQFFIRTNSGGRNFRLVSASVSDPSRAHWKEIVPHRADVMLEQVEHFAHHTVLVERHDARVRLAILDRKTGQTTAVAMPDEPYQLEVDENPEASAASFRFTFESATTPTKTIEVDWATHTQTTLKAVAPPTYDSSKYETAFLHATARDGTRVPISIAHKKGMIADRTHPMFLQGYGAYGISFEANFSSALVSLLDRGVVLAVAHIRGGGDLGKTWHDAGRMENKKNTFTDFIDCAEYLVQSGWVAKDALAIYGGSAGGLLMGAVTNMRPDLFRAVVARVPFVDVVNTMLDASLPLTVGEFEEWGNPKIAEEYGWIAAYSPYDNIAKKAYPSILVTTSYNDSQVMYWEPAKYVAKLRAMKTDAHPLVLKTNMEPAGHGGQSGRYDRLRERAYDFAFVLHELGLAGAGAP